jgi:hypothetical protein
MVRLVEFDDVTEERVRFIEETPRGEIVERTLARLAAGDDAEALVAAAGLAVSRSAELPADHHGGPVHPVSGIHAVIGMGRRLDGDDSILPVLQSVALANKHIHLPSMGPAAMVAFDDLNRDVDADTVLARLERAIGEREGRLAERAVTLACENAPPGRILNSLLTVALKRNSLDDHYLLYPVYAARALDAIGWQWGPVLLRPVVRYLSRHASFDAYGEFTKEFIDDGIAYFDRFGELEGLVDMFGLTESRVRRNTGSDEDDAIAALADEIGEVAQISSLPEIVASGMGEGLSLEGTLEAMSIGGARIFLRSHTANPFDVHIFTGLAARRYLLGFPEIDFRHKVLLLLGWAWSYEVRYLDHTLHWTWQRPAGELSSASPDALLAEIERRILAIDGYDITELPVAINDLVAPDGVREAVRLAESYVKAGHDTDPLFRLTARLVCREDASEMHGYKLQQAAFEEYQACRAPLRWVHAVAAVKQAAVNASTKPYQVYPQIAALAARAA